MFERLAVDAAIVAGFGVGAYKMGALDWKGTLAASLLGLAVLELGGLYPFLALLTFALLGALATKYRYDEKRERKVAQSNNGVRSWGNVLGNGLPVLIFLIIERLSMLDVFWAATFSAIATVNGDTLASELGKVLGKSPRLITNLKPAKPGTNGAVSIEGELFALLGSIVIALFALPLTELKAQMFLAVTLGGFIGANLDSLIGATLENKRLIDNNATNFLAGLFGGLIGAGIFYVLT